MKLFVGLGNPGGKHERNRHNVGFMALDEIASHYNFPAWRKRFQGETADGRIDGERILLLKPQTYMNESGRSVGEAARFLKIPIEDIVVFYDEIDLAPGKLKAKTGGGNAGHNGLRSISAHLENDYRRVRIGVGHPGDKARVANYVLNDFSKADQDWLAPLLEAISKSATYLARNDDARFLSAVATTLRPAKPKEPKPSKPEKDRPVEKTAEPDKAPNQDAPARRRASKSTNQHPAGERATKRANAMADNLKKWLQARKKED